MKKIIPIGLFEEKEPYTKFDEYTLYEFFGVDSLTEKYIADASCDQIEFDFSLIKYWDLTALMWLVVALKHYFYPVDKFSHNVRFLIRLPNPSDAIELEKSADFLIRWEFDSALTNLIDDISEILVDEQKDYFERKIENYKPVAIEGYFDTDSELLSKNLVEIRNIGANGVISNDSITRCTKVFSSSIMANVLIARAGVGENLAQAFSSVLVKEGLSNMKEHPDATLGMITVGINRINQTRSELILIMVDDGDPVQKTIKPHYAEYLKANKLDGAQHVEETEDVFALRDIHRIKMLNFATEPGVSRKYNYHDYKEQDGKFTYGMGLTNIRECATLKAPEGFSGNLRIISGGVSGKFSTSGLSNDYDPSGTNLSRFNWNGNLIRISIPISSV